MAEIFAQAVLLFVLIGLSAVVACLIFDPDLE